MTQLERIIKSNPGITQGWNVRVSLARKTLTQLEAQPSSAHPAVSGLPRNPGVGDARQGDAALGPWRAVEVEDSPARWQTDSHALCGGSLPRFLTLAVEPAKSQLEERRLERCS